MVTNSQHFNVYNEQISCLQCSEDIFFFQILLLTTLLQIILQNQKIINHNSIIDIHFKFK